MQLKSNKAIEEVINMIELGLDEHAKWINLWNTRAICHMSFPVSFLMENSSEECVFSKWFQSFRNEDWLQEVDYDSIRIVHRTMHEEARDLARKIEQGQQIKEEDYYSLISCKWSFTQQLQRLKDKIARLQISFDPLTGIFNRQAMMPVLLQEQAYVQRDGKLCCLAMADLDYFKHINDTYGHANGDIVLQKIVEFFKSHLRPYDALFRYGGEEFLFCLPNTDLEKAQGLLDRLRSDLKEVPIKLSVEEEITISISMGITQMYPTVAVEEAIIRADKALYQAKRNGRDQVIAWENVSLN